jgi:outer membrane receptor protein involved in Fe transport
LKLRAFGAWGRAWAYRQAYYDNLAAHAQPGQYDPFDLANPSKDRLPPYIQVDTGIAFEHPIAGASVQIRANVLNVFDKKNVVDWSLFRSGDQGGLQNTERRMPGITTVLTFRVKF